MNITREEFNRARLVWFKSLPWHTKATSIGLFLGFLFVAIANIVLWVMDIPITFVTFAGVWGLLICSFWYDRKLHIMFMKDYQVAMTILELIDLSRKHPPK